MMEAMDGDPDLKIWIKRLREESRNGVKIKRRNENRRWRFQNRKGEKKQERS